MSAPLRSRAKVSVNKENQAKHEIQEDFYQLQPWMPSAYTAFKLLLSVRLCAAIWSYITDCDEVYNYWEPMHFLMHGHGFQTWEYSPVYAIRSYAYLWLHIMPLRLYTSVFSANRVLQFYFLRCVLAFVCSLCEIYFYRAVCKHLGANTGRLTLCFLLFSSGMFISCTAYLPSTFTMYLTMTCLAGWMFQHYPVAIFSVAFGSIVGWPFAGIIGIPVAWDLVIRQRSFWLFIRWSAFSFVICIVPLIQIDSHYYGGLVIAPLNIILYNIFSTHGPNLYGVEHWTFYLLNGFLNFNLVFILALISLPLSMCVKYKLKQQHPGLPLWLLLGGMYIWMAIFCTQPHKEERFLFPIYPLFCLGAAISLDHIQKFYSYVMPKSKRHHYTESSNWLAAICAIMFAMLSLSRTLALYHAYHAPMDIYSELTRVSLEPKIHSLPADKDINVCVGKEWYRFSSSFFLPDKWHLQFIKSEFKGQLPKQYSHDVHATRKIPSHMNDQNLEEPSRYVNISRCHYIIDLDLPTVTNMEPRYAKLSDEWKVIVAVKFLDASRSHKLFRAFYIPYISERYTTYLDYVILKTRRTKKHGKF